MPIHKRKLHLHRETVRVLTSSEMLAVAGGGMLSLAACVTWTCGACQTIPPSLNCRTTTTVTKVVMR